MAEYRLRYFFDPGAGVCLWADNAATLERFDYPVDAEHLSLPENTWRRVLYICAWFDTSLDWNYPPNPSPWDQAERARFDLAAQQLLTLLREQLGSEYEIVDQSGTAGRE